VDEPGKYIEALLLRAQDGEDEEEEKKEIDLPINEPTDVPTNEPTNECGHRLDYARKRLKDEDMLEFNWSKDCYPYREIDFSNNSITDIGLKPLLALCARCPSLQVLKLFRNQISDMGARLLADLFESCKSIREVHLSHNRITTEGIEALVIATQRSRPTTAGVLWLRVENNAVLDSRALLNDLEARHGVCPRKLECTQFKCSKGSKVHLPFLDMRRERAEKDDIRRGLGLRSARSPLARRSPVARSSPVPSGHRHHGDGSHRRRDSSHGQSRRVRLVSPHRRRKRSRSSRRSRKDRRSKEGKRRRRSEESRRSETSRRRPKRRLEQVPCPARESSRRCPSERRSKKPHRHGGLNGSSHVKPSRSKPEGEHRPTHTPRSPPPPVPSKALLPQDLQERLDRLLGRIG